MMNYYMATYTTALNIMDVFPILFSGEAADRFEFNPPLVAGLNANAQGRITGRPIQSTDGINRDTTVTAFIAGGSTRTCKFSYDTKGIIKNKIRFVKTNSIQYSMEYKSSICSAK